MKRINNSTSANRTVPYDLSAAIQIVQQTASPDSVSPMPNVVIASYKSAHQQSKLENAIYSHIRAVRALGRKSINTLEISQALSLPLVEVDRALKALKRKGVKAL